MAHTSVPGPCVRICGECEPADGSDGRWIDETCWTVRAPFLVFLVCEGIHDDGTLVGSHNHDDGTLVGSYNSPMKTHIRDGSICQVELDF